MMLFVADNSINHCLFIMPSEIHSMLDVNCIINRVFLVRTSDFPLDCK